MLHKAYETIGNAIKEQTGLPEAQLIDGGEHADLASTVAFSLAKEKRQAPVKIAQELAIELAKKPGTCRGNG